MTPKPSIEFDEKKPNKYLTPAQKIECGYCKHGLDSPSGFCKTWEPVARVVSGIVYGVSTKDGVRYEVGNSSLYERALFDNEPEAAAFCKLEFERVKALADKYFEESFVRCKASQIWSAGYHKECIKRDERSIEWHKLRLGMIKEKSK